MKLFNLFIPAVAALVALTACSTQKDSAGDPVCTKVVATLTFGEVSQDLLDNYSFTFKGVDFNGKSETQELNGPFKKSYVGDGLRIDYTDGEKYPVTLGIVVVRKGELTKDSYSFQLNYNIHFDYYDASGNKLKDGGYKPFNITTEAPLTLTKDQLLKEMEGVGSHLDKGAINGMAPKTFKFYRGGAQGDRWFNWVEVSD